MAIDSWDVKEANDQNRTEVIHNGKGRQENLHYQCVQLAGRTDTGALSTTGVGSVVPDLKVGDTCPAGRYPVIDLVSDIMACWLVGIRVAKYRPYNTRPRCRIRMPSE